MSRRGIQWERGWWRNWRRKANPLDADPKLRYLTAYFSGVGLGARHMKPRAGDPPELVALAEEGRQRRRAERRRAWATLVSGIGLPLAWLVAVALATVTGRWLLVHAWGMTSGRVGEQLNSLTVAIACTMVATGLEIHFGISSQDGKEGASNRTLSMLFLTPTLGSILAAVAAAVVH